MEIKGRGSSEVATRIDRRAEVGNHLGSSEQRADLQPGWQQRGGAEHQPRDRGRATTADRTPSLASCRPVPVNARVAIRMDTAKPIPAIVPTPATAAQPTGGRAGRG